MHYKLDAQASGFVTRVRFEPNENALRLLPEAYAYHMLSNHSLALRACIQSISVNNELDVRGFVIRVRFERNEDALHVA